jgi:hypothetical protein
MRKIVSIDVWTFAMTTFFVQRRQLTYNNKLSLLIQNLTKQPLV